MDKKPKKVNLFVVLSRIWKYYRPLKRGMIISLIFVVLGQLTFSVSPFLSGRIIDSVTHRNQDIFLYYLALMSVLMVFRWLINVLSDRNQIANLANDLDVHLHRISTEKYMSFSLGQHLSKHSSIKTSIINRGINSIQSIGNMFIFELFPIMFNMIVPLVLISIVSKLLGLIMLLSVISIIWYSIWYSKRFLTKISNNIKNYEEASRIRGDYRNNIETVISFSKEKESIENSEVKYHNASELSKKMWLNYKNFFSVGSLSQTISLIVLQLISGYFVFNGEITVGIFITLTAWFTQGIGQLQSISWIQRRMMTFYVDVIKFDKFMSIKANIVDNPNAKEITGLNESLKFNNVSFAYPKRAKEKSSERKDFMESIFEAEMIDENIEYGNPTIKGLNLEFKKGKKYAIVGHSGAGKTTIVHLLLRAYDPQDGSITIDGTDLRDVKMTSLKKNIGVVPQEIAIFDGTLRDNILFGLFDSKKITDEELMQVVKHSRVDEFLPNLENGLNTMLGEKGLKLSGGQRQRVGIARAMIKNPDILIFDEATSHLDMKNEEMIRKSILEVSNGKTLITIAHRLATVRDMDEIIVMKNGAVVGQGTHGELAESNPIYQDLIKSQVF